MSLGGGGGPSVVVAVSCHGPTMSPDGGRSDGASGASLRHH